MVIFLGNNVTPIWRQIGIAQYEVYDDAIYGTFNFFSLFKIGLISLTFYSPFFRRACSVLEKQVFKNIIVHSACYDHDRRSANGTSKTM